MERMSFIPPIIPLFSGPVLLHGLQRRLEGSVYLIVPRGEERIRVVVHANISGDEIDRLVDQVVLWLQRQWTRHFLFTGNTSLRQQLLP